MRPWYKNYLRIASQPYAFLEDALSYSNPLPALVFFFITLFLTVFGWQIALAKNFHPSIQLLTVGLLLPMLTYPLEILVIYLVCHLMVRENQLRSFFIIWGYSYLPTFLFFCLNITAHTLSPWLIQLPWQPLLRLTIWTSAFLMFLWKLLFTAITLRLAGNLNAGQIFIALVILGVITVAYWSLTFSLGWVKVPFI